MIYIIYDLEATCWEGYPLASQQEIIEIAAFAVPQGEGISNKVFQSFVRPVLAPTLSTYCKRLTNIPQSKIDEADDFKIVNEKFSLWLEEFNEEIILCSWGDKDIEFLKNDTRLHEIDLAYLNAAIDIKHAYYMLKELPHKIGLSNALKAENIEAEGEQHRAYWDAFNLTRLFMKYRSEWAQYLEYYD